MSEIEKQIVAKRYYVKLHNRYTLCYDK